MSSSSEAKDLDGKGIIIPGCLLEDDTSGCGLLLPFVFRVAEDVDPYRYALTSIIPFPVFFERRGRAREGEENFFAKKFSSPSRISHI